MRLSNHFRRTQKSTNKVTPYELFLLEGLRKIFIIHPRVGALEEIRIDLSYRSDSCPTKEPIVSDLTRIFFFIETILIIETESLKRSRVAQST